MNSASGQITVGHLLAENAKAEVMREKQLNGVILVFRIQQAFCYNENNVELVSVSQSAAAAADSLHNSVLRTAKL
jgi:hypothetical protein